MSRGAIIPGLEWRNALRRIECAECGHVVCTGERYALYTEVLAITVLTREHCSTKSLVCHDCGVLIEDSLTTTEDVQ